MIKHIRTALIPVAGWGTRWLPLTKVIEKSMLPVGTRPIIDWIVADCVRAGVTRIIFVAGAQHEQIQRYFSHNAELEEYLNGAGKTKLLDQVSQPAYNDITFEYVVQPNDGIYGTAYPLALAAQKLDLHEAFLCQMGDDFIYRDDGSSELVDFIAAWRDSDADSMLMSRRVSPEEATSYGVLFTNDHGELKEIREKPALQAMQGMTAANLNIGKYIFEPSIIHDALEYMKHNPTNPTGEYYLTDVVNNAINRGQRFALYQIEGEHLDVGTPSSWLHTNQRIAGV